MNISKQKRLFYYILAPMPLKIVNFSRLLLIFNQQ
jgi:hypothetical protein